MDIKNLTIKDIRNRKPGLSVDYHRIYENLSEYIYRIVQKNGFKVRDCKRLAGESNVNVRVITNKDDLIIRISPWRGELLTSNVFYKTIIKASIPSPKVKVYDTTLSVIPFEYQIINYIQSSRLRYSEKHNAGMALGKILRKLHSIKGDGFGSPINEIEWKYKGWLEALQDIYQKDAFMKSKTKLYSNREIKNIERFTFFNNTLNIRKPYLLHGDISIKNCLFRTGKSNVELVALIDPGSLISGDPMLDLAMTSNDNNKFSQGVLESYDLGQLTSDEKYRFYHLKLLCSYWTSCYAYKTKGNFHKWRLKTMKNLEKL